MNKSNDLAILVMSYDKYWDLWDGFYTLLNKYWQDCPFEIYHVSDTIKLEDKIDTKKLSSISVNSIVAGEGKTWSGCALKALEQIKQKYVLLLLDDYFLIKPAQTNKIITILEIMDKEKAAHFRIFPAPRPRKKYKNYTDVGILEPNTEYSNSTQATIWNKKALQKMLIPEEQIWHFEVQGSYRTADLDAPLLSITTHTAKNEPLENGEYPYTYLCTAVYKGKWMQEAAELCKKEGIKMNLEYRGIETDFERFHRRIYDKLPYIGKYILDFVKFKIVTKFH